MSKQRSTGGRGSKKIMTRHVDELRERVQAKSSEKPKERRAGFRAGRRYPIEAEMATKLEAYIAGTLPGIRWTVDRSRGSRFVSYLMGSGEHWQVWLTDGRRADVTVSKNLGEIESVHFTSGPDPSRPEALR